VDRLFLDANVLFSAAYRATSDLTRLWHIEGVHVITSAYALEEARRAIGHGERLSRLDHLSSLIQIADVPSSLAPAIDQDVLGALALLPAKDRPILLGAIEVGATHLLTGDLKHFGSYFGKTVGGVLVLRPAQYLRQREE
jgi:uncharacterized protein